MLPTGPCPKNTGAQDLGPTNGLDSAGQESTIGRPEEQEKDGVLVENLGYVRMASRRHCTPKAS